MPKILRQHEIGLAALLLGIGTIFACGLSYAQGDWLPSSITVTTDDHIVALLASYDVYGLVKLDQTGNILWRKRHGVRDESDFHALTIAPFDDGGFIVLGHHSYDHPVFRIYDRDGRQLREFSLDIPTILGALFRLSDGNYLVGGGELPRRVEDGHTGAGLLAKFDAAGSILWQQRYDYENETDIFSIGELKNGEIALAMNYGEMSKFGPVEAVVRIAVCDSSGNVLRSTNLTDTLAANSGAMKSSVGTIYLSYIESLDSEFNEEEWDTLNEVPEDELSEEDIYKIYSMMFRYVTRVKAIDPKSLKTMWESGPLIFNGIFNPVVSLWPDNKVVVFGGEIGNSRAEICNAEGKVERTVRASTKIPRLNNVNVGDCDASDSAAYALGSSTVIDPPDFEFNPGTFIYKVTADSDEPEWFKFIDTGFPPEP